MYLDYKITEEKSDASGEIYYQKVRYYEGSIQAVAVQNPDTLQVDTVDQYVRNLFVEEVEYYYE